MTRWNWILFQREAGLPCLRTILFPTNTLGGSEVCRVLKDVRQFVSTFMNGYEFVPRKLVLGSLLFLIKVNELPEEVTSCKHVYE